MNRWPKQLVFVRHAESEGNAKRVSLVEKPTHAFELTSWGCEQAQLIGTYLRSEYGEFDAYYVSTYQRSQQTFALMYPDAKPRVDSRLDERSWGIFHKTSEDQADALYPEEKRFKVHLGRYHYRAPAGESGNDVDLRIYSFLQQMRLDHANQRVLAVGHGSWLLLAWRLLLNRSLQDLEQRIHESAYPNCTIVVYEWENGEVRLKEDNQVIVPL